ncbi:DUF7674 family protein [Acutalibacter intestini]|uniref:DUF7674 family protein n=1 Tax=Acutalibacter intestini TaxID=3093659 RepID=UPI002AC8E881|nr:hypothetical protein [Acutalibacter sp. M00204]
MDFNPFQLIQNALSQELCQQGFGEAQDLEDPAGQAVMFVAADVAYSLLYDDKRKSFILRSTSLTDGKPGDWRELSRWLFDKMSGERADAESILNDFLDVVRGPKRVAIVQQRKKRGQDERNIDPMFFINRLVNIFPELKDQLNQEKIVYGQVRFVTFIKHKVVPLCEDLVNQYPDSEPVQKLCGLLDDMYKNGDMDLRSIVTYVLLNGLSAQAYGKLASGLGEELQKISGFSRKLIGKNIKPEKKKKKSGKKVEARLDKR